MGHTKGTKPDQPEGSKMLFISDDKTRFICTTADGAPCFMRGEHISIAKSLGVDLSTLDNVTSAFHFKGKGQSIKSFLNKA